MIKIPYEIKSKKIGKLQNDPKHIHNVQIVLIDKKTIWVWKDGKPLSRETGNGRNRGKNSTEKMGKGVQKRTLATLAFYLARDTSLACFTRASIRKQDRCSLFTCPPPRPPTFIPATGHAVNVKSSGTRKIEQFYFDNFEL